MKTAWYESNGEAKDVMTVGERPTPQAGLDQVVQAHEMVEAGQSIGNVMLAIAH